MAISKDKPMAPTGAPLEVTTGPPVAKSSLPIEPQAPALEMPLAPLGPTAAPVGSPLGGGLKPTLGTAPVRVASGEVDVDASLKVATDEDPKLAGAIDVLHKSKDRGEAFFRRYDLGIPATNEKASIFVRVGVPPEDIERFMATGEMTPRMQELWEQAQHPPKEKFGPAFQAYGDALMMARLMFVIADRKQKAHIGALKKQIAEAHKANNPALETKLKAELKLCEKQNSDLFNVTYMPVLNAGNANLKAWKAEVRFEADSAASSNPAQAAKQYEVLGDQATHEAKAYAAAGKTEASEVAANEAVELHAKEGEVEAKLSPQAPDKVPGLIKAKADLALFGNPASPFYLHAAGKVEASTSKCSDIYTKSLGYDETLTPGEEKALAAKKTLGGDAAVAEALKKKGAPLNADEETKARFEGEIAAEGEYRSGIADLRFAELGPDKYAEVKKWRAQKLRADAHAYGFLDAAVTALDKPDEKLTPAELALKPRVAVDYSYASALWLSEKGRIDRQLASDADEAADVLPAELAGLNPLEADHEVDVAKHGLTVASQKLDGLMGGALKKVPGFEEKANAGITIASYQLDKAKAKAELAKKNPITAADVLAYQKKCADLDEKIADKAEWAASQGLKPDQDKIKQAHLKYVHAKKANAALKDAQPPPPKSSLDSDAYLDAKKAGGVGFSDKVADDIEAKTDKLRTWVTTTKSLSEPQKLGVTAAIHTSEVALDAHYGAEEAHAAAKQKKAAAKKAALGATVTTLTAAKTKTDESASTNQTIETTTSVVEKVGGVVLLGIPGGQVAGIALLAAKPASSALHTAFDVSGAQQKSKLYGEAIVRLEGEKKSAENAEASEGGKVIALRDKRAHLAAKMGTTLAAYDGAIPTKPGKDRDEALLGSTKMHGDVAVAWAGVGDAGKASGELGIGKSKADAIAAPLPKALAKKSLEASAYKATERAWMATAGGVVERDAKGDVVPPPHVPTTQLKTLAALGDDADVLSREADTAALAVAEPHPSELVAAEADAKAIKGASLYRSAVCRQLFIDYAAHVEKMRAAAVAQLDEEALDAHIGNDDHIHGITWLLGVSPICLATTGKLSWWDAANDWVTNGDTADGLGKINAASELALKGNATFAGMTADAYGKSRGTGDAVVALIVATQAGFPPALKTSAVISLSAGVGEIFGSDYKWLQKPPGEPLSLVQSATITLRKDPVVKAWGSGDAHTLSASVATSTELSEDFAEGAGAHRYRLEWLEKNGGFWLMEQEFGALLLSVALPMAGGGAVVGGEALEAGTLAGRSLLALEKAGLVVSAGERAFLLSTLRIGFGILHAGGWMKAQAFLSEAFASVMGDNRMSKVFGAVLQLVQLGGKAHMAMGGAKVTWTNQMAQFMSGFGLMGGDFLLRNFLLTRFADPAQAEVAGDYLTAIVTIGPAFQGEYHKLNESKGKAALAHQHAEAISEATFKDPAAAAAFGKSLEHYYVNMSGEPHVTVESARKHSEAMRVEVEAYNAKQTDPAKKIPLSLVTMTHGVQLAEVFATQLHTPPTAEDIALANDIAATFDAGLATETPSLVAQKHYTDLGTKLGLQGPALQAFVEAALVRHEARAVTTSVFGKDVFGKEAALSPGASEALSVALHGEGSIDARLSTLEKHLQELPPESRKQLLDTVHDVLVDSEAVTLKESAFAEQWAHMPPPVEEPTLAGTPPESEVTLASGKAPGDTTPPVVEDATLVGMDAPPVPPKPKKVPTSGEVTLDTGYAPEGATLEAVTLEQPKPLAPTGFGAGKGGFEIGDEVVLPDGTHASITAMPKLGPNKRVAYVLREGESTPVQIEIHALTAKKSTVSGKMAQGPVAKSPLPEEAVPNITSALEKWPPAQAAHLRAQIELAMQRLPEHERLDFLRKLAVPLQIIEAHQKSPKTTHAPEISAERLSDVVELFASLRLESVEHFERLVDLYKTHDYSAVEPVARKKLEQYDRALGAGLKDLLQGAKPLTTAGGHAVVEMLLRARSHARAALTHGGDALPIERVTALAKTLSTLPEPIAHELAASLTLGNASVALLPLLERFAPALADPARAGEAVRVLAAIALLGTADPTMTMRLGIDVAQRFIESGLAPTAENLRLVLQQSIAHLSPGASVEVRAQLAALTLERLGTRVVLASEAAALPQFALVHGELAALFVAYPEIAEAIVPKMGWAEPGLLRPNDLDAFRSVYAATDGVGRAKLLAYLSALEPTERLAALRAMNDAYLGRAPGTKPTAEVLCARADAVVASLRNPATRAATLHSLREAPLELRREGKLVEPPPYTPGKTPIKDFGEAAAAARKYAFEHRAELVQLLHDNPNGLNALATHLALAMAHKKGMTPHELFQDVYLGLKEVLLAETVALAPGVTVLVAPGYESAQVAQHLAQLRFMIEAARKAGYSFEKNPQVLFITPPGAATFAGEWFGVDAIGMAGEKLKVGKATVNVVMAGFSGVALEGASLAGETLVHEFGHVLDLAGAIKVPVIENGQSKLVTLGEWQQKRKLKGAGSVSEYGKNNAVEYTAEAIRDYMYDGAALKARDPELYAVLEKFFGPPPPLPDAALADRALVAEGLGFFAVAKGQSGKMAMGTGDPLEFDWKTSAGPDSQSPDTLPMGKLPADVALATKGLSEKDQQRFKDAWERPGADHALLTRWAKRGLTSQALNALQPMQHLSAYRLTYFNEQLAERESVLFGSDAKAQTEALAELTMFTTAVEKLPTPLAAKQFVDATAACKRDPARAQEYALRLQLLDGDAAVLEAGHTILENDHTHGVARVADGLKHPRAAALLATRAEISLAVKYHPERAKIVEQHAAIFGWGATNDIGVASWLTTHEVRRICEALVMLDPAQLKEVTRLLQQLDTREKQLLFLKVLGARCGKLQATKANAMGVVPSVKAMGEIREYGGWLKTKTTETVLHVVDLFGNVPTVVDGRVVFAGGFSDQSYTTSCAPTVAILVAAKADPYLAYLFNRDPAKFMESQRRLMYLHGGPFERAQKTDEYRLAKEIIDQQAATIDLLVAQGFPLSPLEATALKHWRGKRTNPDDATLSPEHKGEVKTLTALYLRMSQTPLGKVRLENAGVHDVRDFITCVSVGETGAVGGSPLLMQLPHTTARTGLSYFAENVPGFDLSKPENLATLERALREKGPVPIGVSWKTDGMGHAMVIVGVAWIDVPAKGGGTVKKRCFAISDAGHRVVMVPIEELGQPDVVRGLGIGEGVITQLFIPYEADSEAPPLSLFPGDANNGPLSVKPPSVKPPAEADTDISELEPPTLKMPPMLDTPEAKAALKAPKLPSFGSSSTEGSAAPVLVAPKAAEGSYAALKPANRSAVDKAIAKHKAMLDKLPPAERAELEATLLAVGAESYGFKSNDTANPDAVVQRYLALRAQGAAATVAVREYFALPEAIRRHGGRGLWLAVLADGGTHAGWVETFATLYAKAPAEAQRLSEALAAIYYTDWFASSVERPGVREAQAQLVAVLMAQAKTGKIGAPFVPTSEWKSALAAVRMAHLSEGDYAGFVSLFTGKSVAEQALIVWVTARIKSAEGVFSPALVSELVAVFKEAKTEGEREALVNIINARTRAGLPFDRAAVLAVLKTLKDKGLTEPCADGDADEKRVAQASAIIGDTFDPLASYLDVKAPAVLPTTPAPLKGANGELLPHDSVEGMAVFRAGLAKKMALPDASLSPAEKAVLVEVFGQPVSRAAFEAMFTPPYPGCKAEVQLVAINGAVGVTVTLRDANGLAMATFQVTFARAEDGHLVQHTDIVKVDQAYQGVGLQAHIARQQVEFLRLVGDEHTEIKLEASMNVGVMAWAAAGYSFDPAHAPTEAELMTQQFYDWLDQELADGRPGFTPERVARLKAEVGSWADPQPWKFYMLELKDPGQAAVKLTYPRAETGETNIVKASAGKAFLLRAASPWHGRRLPLSPKELPLPMGKKTTSTGGVKVGGA